MGNDRARRRAGAPQEERPNGPTQGTFVGPSDGAAWTSRPWAAHAVAAIVRGGPLVVGTIAGVCAARVFPRPVGLGWALWLAGIVIVSQTAVRVTDRFARRLLPLSVMLRFSLAFPDHAPSRFATALRAGNVERLRRETAETVAHGLPLDMANAISAALAMIASLHRHDRGTRGHSERVRAFSEMLAEEMGLTREFRERLRWGALLHDMGKLSVPPEILNKSGRPSEEEWAILQRHPAEGERILAPLAGWLGDAVHAAGQHHERWDGNGYPKGLRGEQIALSARIVAVADAFAVMTAARAYKRPLPMAVARAELTKNSGTQFDPAVVRAMLSASVGKVSQAAGPFAALGSVPIVATILAAAPTVPAVITSGAAAAALTFGLAVPGSPIEWGRTVSVERLEEAEPASPEALAFMDGGGGVAVGAPAVPTNAAASDGRSTTTSKAATSTTPSVAATSSTIQVSTVSSPFSEPTPATNETAMTSTSVDPAPTSPGAPVEVATVPVKPAPQSTSTIASPATSTTSATSATSTIDPKSTTSVAASGTTTTTLAPSETKVPPTTGVATTTTGAPAETIPTTLPPPAETTPPIIETTTTVSDTKGPRMPPFVTTTTSPTAKS